jgi:hypothetical protein
MMRRPLLAVLGIAMAVVAACSSTNASVAGPAASGAAAKSVSVAPHHTELAAAKKRCRADQLRAHFSYRQADQDGLLMSSVTFINFGTKACYLQGHPPIRPLGKHKDRVRVEAPAFAGLSPAKGPGAGQRVYPESNAKQRHVVVDVYFQGNNPHNTGCRSSKVDYLRVPVSKVGHVLVRLPRRNGGIIICNGRFGNDWFHT